MHGEILEADLLREYGVDLLGVYTGRLSLRRLRVLVQGLSRDCLTVRRLTGTPTEYDGHSTEAIYLALQLEAETEQEILPRPSQRVSTVDSSTTAPAEIPTVSAFDLARNGGLFLEPTVVFEGG